jgi:hypothetical protein
VSPEWFLDGCSELESQENVVSSTHKELEKSKYVSYSYYSKAAPVVYLLFSD